MGIHWAYLLAFVIRWSDHIGKQTCLYFIETLCKYSKYRLLSTDSLRERIRRRVSSICRSVVVFKLGASGGLKSIAVFFADSDLALVPALLIQSTSMESTNVLPIR